MQLPAAVYYEDQNLWLGFYEDVPCMYLKQEGSFSSAYLSMTYFPKVSQFIQTLGEQQGKMKAFLSNFSGVTSAVEDFPDLFVSRIIPEMRRIGIKYSVSIAAAGNSYGQLLTNEIKKRAIRANIIPMVLSGEYIALSWIRNLNKPQ